MHFISLTCQTKKSNRYSLLEVECASGQNAPYISYVELSLTFSLEFVGEEMDVKTLALVVPDL